MLTYPFTEQDMERAADEWGCNCGPASLAFALQKPLEYVRGKIPGFAERGYTSPTMMKQALEALRQPWRTVPADKGAMFQWLPCLVRLQWCGPWTQPGANPKWAYRQTHWIATYMVECQAAMVFDCNSGILGFQRWRDEIVPLITSSYKRASGEWFPTHIWQIVSGLTV
jgi:hypothetical protein